MRSELFIYESAYSLTTSSYGFADPRVTGTSPGCSLAASPSPSSPPSTEVSPVPPILVGMESRSLPPEPLPAPEP